MIIINNELNKQTGVTNEEANQNANHYLLDSTGYHSGYIVFLSGWQWSRAMTDKNHKQLREDLVHFIASLYEGLPAPVLTHDYLRDIVKPTAEEVEEYFDNEGGNTERAFEMFGVQPDDLKYPRGE